MMSEVRRRIDLLRVVKVSTSTPVVCRDSLRIALASPEREVISTVAGSPLLSTVIVQQTS